MGYDKSEVFEVPSSKDAKAHSELREVLRSLTFEIKDGEVFWANPQDFGHKIKLNDERELHIREVCTKALESLPS